MCYAEGSVDQAVNVCPMCKVFPHARCPHVRDVCRNRALHPRLDVLFLKNAEVDWFNGCGYCKWARTNPPAKSAGFNNPGWPGCCRPPSQSEYRMIQAADWRSVSLVHHIPIPSEIKAALDGLTAGARPSSAKSLMPSLDRRSSSGGGSGSPPTRSGILSSKASAASAASKGRSSSSPKQPAATLSSPRGNGSTLSGPIPGATPTESRRDTPEKDKFGSRSAHSSPSRKHADLDNSTTPRRNSGSRAAVASLPTSKAAPTESRSNQSRRGTISAPVTSSAAKSATSSRNITTTTALASRSSKKDDAMSSASSNSGGSDSLSDSTITSDGGFTDYLSDESEAELQRQAEAQAALLAQNKAEELEFKAARQQLAHIDLRPPKSWNPTNITNGTTAPRLAQVSTTKG